MPKRKLTVGNIPIVWLRLTAEVTRMIENKEAAKALVPDLDEFIDRLADQDAFGTEGQCDPRGDQRD
jgi:hypothetical protein